MSSRLDIERQKELQDALQNQLWLNHNIGDVYSMINVGGKKDEGWKIAYYPLFGSYKENIWIDFLEPRALIEKEIIGGTDFREIPLRYLLKQLV